MKYTEQEIPGKDLPFGKPVDQNAAMQDTLNTRPFTGDLIIPCDVLQRASEQIEDRTSQRDQVGERSMLATVRAFNGMFTQDLTEEQGWHFMVLLKMSRSKYGNFRLDDYVDGAAYTALASEARQKEL